MTTKPNQTNKHKTRLRTGYIYNVYVKGKGLHETTSIAWP